MSRLRLEDVKYPVFKETSTRLYEFFTLPDTPIVDDRFLIYRYLHQGVNEERFINMDYDYQGADIFDVFPERLTLLNRWLLQEKLIEAPIIVHTPEANFDLNTNFKELFINFLRRYKPKSDGFFYSIPIAVGLSNNFSVNSNFHLSFA